MNQSSNKVEIKISDKNINYLESVKFMQAKVDSIFNNIEKELIWFLFHDHIYTCGTSADKNEILVKTNIPVFDTNRGGKTTYHGPGQRIVYLMINLNKRKKDIRRFINLIEQSVIYLLKDFNIETTTFNNRVGIWVTKANGITFSKEKKIGAIGLRIKKWVTYHGLSFNINPDLQYYNYIEACGLADYSATSLYDLGINLSQQEFDKIFYNIFKKELKKL